jgi:hypothetical protein|tara:strand:+ start:863 stop:1102 length:240 start_codon:yes stop_codon:yes gene_type:complete
MGKRKRKVSRERLGQVLGHAVQMAEELFADVPKSGAAKKEWCVDWVNDHLDLPWLNERQEARLIGLLVDVAVGLVFKRL